MSKTIQKRIISVLAVAILLLATVFPLCGSAYAEEKSVNFDETDIMTDLTSSIGSDGQAFNISDYGFNSSGGILTVHNVVEYGYSNEVTDFYGLYIYIYNEPGLNISVDGNSISMAVETTTDKNGTSYERFSLQFCSRTEGDYAGLFYKFKVVDHVDAYGKTLHDRVDKNNRVYNFGAIYLNVDGAMKAYNFGLHCEFSGFAKGLDDSSLEESTLSGTVNKNDTITFDLKSTFYRPDTEYKENVQMQLNSVYFSVPEEYFVKYGNVVKISGDFWEYKTRDIIVTDDEDLYNHFIYDSDLGLYINDKYHMYSDVIDVEYNGGEDIRYHYGWAHNPYYDRYDLTFEEGAEVGGLAYVFKIPEGENLDNYVLSGEELLAYMNSYSSKFTKGYRMRFNGRNLSGNLFYSEADEGRHSGYNMFSIGIDPSDEESYTEYNLMIRENQRGWWSTFWKGPDYEEIVPQQFEGIQAIIEVDPSALVGDVSETLFVDSSDVEEFKTFVTTEKDKNRRTILFRFAVTDYLSSSIDSKGRIFNPPDSYRVRQTVFFDFSVISLTFCTGGVYREIPTVASPIDIVADVTPPVEPLKSNWLSELLDILKRIFGDAWKWVKIVFWVVVALIIVVIVVKVLRFLFGTNRRR